MTPMHKPLIQDVSNGVESVELVHTDRVMLLTLTCESHIDNTYLTANYNKALFRLPLGHFVTTAATVIATDFCVDPTVTAVTHYVGTTPVCTVFRGCHGHMVSHDSKLKKVNCHQLYSCMFSGSNHLLSESTFSCCSRCCSLCRCHSHRCCCPFQHFISPASTP